MSLHDHLVRTTRRLAGRVDRLTFDAPVAMVYDPLVYARAPHEAYLALARADVEALFIGMNPGPFGMVQTGVPFGEVTMVRDWLGISGLVRKPAGEHPKRPVDGFACRRSEVSGRRFWGWAKNRFETPAAFFARFFVWNYCPLAFLEASGKNRTPNQLPAAEREPLFEACDDALRELVAAIRPRKIVGIGGFARDRARIALDRDVGTLLHPSPASPIANRGWARQAEAELEAMGVTLP